MDEVKEEFLVTKTIQEVEVEREMDINFVGVYITSDDKLPIEYYQKAMNFHRKGDRTIFIFICDIETFIFCEESFDGKHAVGDARILRTSVKTFDFALMTSCNSTIVSNDVGVLHALLNNGVTTVYKPKLTEEPDYYVPWMISEHMANWYAID
ncbi:CLUMA_CG015158, isoform A [Clunio marinus]|uniref:CLUMA_CG015158, isoform A n=1 Tax=Clunio marinus TaxID=568069 RepID=A0A1J1IQH0_9DIPT|nr:CLUMA_CG015158, isoform A [Clunio marinus]